MKVKLSLSKDSNLLNSVEYQKCPFKRHFYKLRAVFAQNVGTKLVLNCEININVAHSLHWYSAYYASLNGSGVEPTYIYNVCGALKGCISKGCRRNQIR